MVPLEIAWFQYVLHMCSLPIWLGAGMKALRMQLNAKPQGSKTSDHQLFTPTEGEFWGVRLLFVYVVADFVRGIDMCLDSTDGACRALWGFVPMWLRFTAWAVRDLALLGAISVEMQCILEWTFKALGLPSPVQECRLLQNTYMFTLCGISGSFWALMATNRQSWQAVAILFVVVLNAAWLRINWKLRYQVIPELEARQLASSGHPPVWALTLLESANRSVRLILFADVVVIVLFTFAAIERLVLKNAHSLPFMPNVSVGSWVGGLTQPMLTEMPPGEELVPLLEVVELLIGWLQFVWMLKLANKSAEMQVPEEKHSEWPPACAYLCGESVGQAFAATLDNCEAKKKIFGGPMSHRAKFA
eukprot:gnl/TRDRNA2_/TRDRNA2_42371_c0_seq1.p1 gnl/TRDRNA2_/TRDRNA2_42371_c0~~gnl/TRDRNA2_/TRDRNA2_42371_c0_seq1.p1  ORF type:complete len:378 (+),score=49.91 gnl/TRDRNA2_/TRDRNA2_42371_c0_seq1:55-1134(+)